MVADSDSRLSALPPLSRLGSSLSGFPSSDTGARKRRCGKQVAGPSHGPHPEGVRCVSTVQVDHPGSRPLSQDELALLESFRARLHERVNSVGLTVDDVRHLLKGMRSHPEASTEVIRIMREEASALMPGQSLFSFDWD